jgi:phosphatidylglycerol:prolipoprotein diacylglycerol transferase
MNNTNWFDPVLVSLGPLEIRWYCLMYVLGFLVGGQILKYLANEKFWPVAKEEIDKYVTWLIVGMFLGARLAYVFIYNWDYYSDHFMDAFAVWKGGLSFHGAVAGMCLATWIFARKHKLHFFQIADCMAVAGSPGLFFGRMGNFINGELYGRVTDSWAGMVFPGGGPFPRHPSQLYEGISEGHILFAILLMNLSYTSIPLFFSSNSKLFSDFANLLYFSHSLPSCIIATFDFSILFNSLKSSVKEGLPYKSIP